MYVSMLSQETKRQFLKTTNEIRYFDGSGTSELEVDEYVDIVDINILYASPNVTPIPLVNWWEVERKNFAKCRIYVNQGAPWQMAAVNYVLRFPVGRANIKVTGDWGYAATIPAMVWEVIRQMAGTHLVHMTLLPSAGGKTAIGPLALWKEAGIMEEYKKLLPEEAFRTHKLWRRVLRDYKRPTSIRSRRMAKTLI